MRIRYTDAHPDAPDWEVIEVGTRFATLREAGTGYEQAGLSIESIKQKFNLVIQRSLFDALVGVDAQGT